MVKAAHNFKKFLKYLAITLAKTILFIVLFSLSVMTINPEAFISIETSEKFARWEYGFVSQENFDELWALAWVICSLLTAIVGYIVIMKLIKTIRKK